MSASMTALARREARYDRLRMRVHNAVQMSDV